MTHFRANPAFEREMRADPTFRRAMHHQADRIADKAEQFGETKGQPWMPRKRNPGRTYVVDDEPNLRVVDTEYGGHLVEFGSKNNPAHSPLRRAVRAAGHRLRKIGKS